MATQGRLIPGGHRHRSSSQIVVVADRGAEHAEQRDADSSDNGVLSDLSDGAADDALDPPDIVDDATVHAEVELDIVTQLAMGRSGSPEHEQGPAKHAEQEQTEEPAFPPLAGDLIIQPKPLYVQHLEEVTGRPRVRNMRLFPEESRRHPHRFYRMTRQIISMLKPVTAMSVFVVLYVTFITERAEDQGKLIIRVPLPYKQPAEDTLEQIVVGSTYNALLVLVAVLVFTAIFTVIYVKYHQRPNVLTRTLQGILFLLLTLWGYFIFQLIDLYRLPIDAISATIVWINFVAVGWFATCYVPVTKQWTISQVFLLCIAFSLMWPFAEFPEGSVWASVITLALYDMCAVMTPCGPLRYIVEQEHQFHVDQLPGVMYQGEFFMLGLGDFIFYGAVVARAAISSELLTAMACTVAIQLGLVFTIILGSRIKRYRAVPALPISIGLGLMFYFTWPFVVLPFTRQHFLDLAGLT